MKKKKPETGGYKTEEMLKAEAKQRAAEQARLEAEAPPASPGSKKRQNYWYHYKWHTIAGIAGIIILAFFLKDVVLRTTPDLTLVLATAQPVDPQSLEALNAALEDAMWDWNGDKKVSVLIDYIHVSPSTETTDSPGEEGDDIPDILGAQESYASIMKLTTVIAAGQDPLYLIDESLYLYFDAMAGASAGLDEEGNPLPEPPDAQSGRMFDPLPIAAAEDDQLPFASTVLAGQPGCEEFAGLRFALRPVRKGKAKETEYYENCLALLEQIAVA